MCKKITAENIRAFPLKFFAKKVMHGQQILSLFIMYVALTLNKLTLFTNNFPTTTRFILLGFFF